MNGMHGHSRTSVKEHIQLTKGFIAAEKENIFNPGWIHILHLHNESQLGENSLARGIHAIRHNHGKSRPQTHIRQQRMDYIANTYQAGDETMSWRGGQLIKI